MIAVDYRDQRPLYEQVRDAYRRQILAGLLEPGTEMPSVRSLAAQLSVNPIPFNAPIMRLKQMAASALSKARAASYRTTPKRLKHEKTNFLPLSTKPCRNFS